ncbi:MAG: SLC13 family permease [Gammaproteobacteria bacterium]|nr:MAG: SLC13 family permease [Gammaproteobacteria bacterium]RLA54277.1 MAG: SLC13 family permease [Gammaproteobacteria bacterium]
MEWQGYFSIALTFATLATLIFTRISPHIVMTGAMALLSASGVLTASEALSGFSNPGLVTVAAMFMVATGIHATGGIDLLVNHLLGQPKTTRGAQLRLCAPVILLSGFLNNTPVVATLIPAISAWGRKLSIPPSKLMIPLSYAAILGGTLTLIGTSTNLIVNSQYQQLTGQPGFPLFAIGMIGLPACLVGLTYMLWFFPRWLPDRGDEGLFGDVREFTLEVAVAHDGPLVGQTVEQAGLRQLVKIYLVEIIRKDSVITAVSSEEHLHGGDRLVFAGNTEAISDLLRIRGIVPASETERPALSQAREERRLVEAALSPHSGCVGQTIRDSRFRDRYGAVILAVARHGERVSGNQGTIRLHAGDTLLLEARPAFVTRQRYNKDFLIINDLEQEQPRHHRAYLAWAILLAVVIAATTEITTMLNAALLGAGAMLATGCCSLNQAHKSLDMNVLVTIGSSFALGVALAKTGVAGNIADLIITMSVGEAWLALVLAYFTVSLLTELINNNAAAILMLPIVLEISAKAGLPAEPFVFAVMMAASASFATPIGYQTNLMVFGPGGYRFSDFIKVGAPMNVLIGIVSISVILFIWPLT